VTRLLRDDSGAALAEAAIVIPVLVLILVGLIEVGRFGDYAIKIAGAARAGVAYGAQNDTTAFDSSGMQAAALGDSGLAGLTATATSVCSCTDGSSVSCTDPNVCPTSRRLVYVNVTVSGTLNSLLNYPGLPASLSNVTISRTATMRVAQ